MQIRQGRQAARARLCHGNSCSPGRPGGAGGPATARPRGAPLGWAPLGPLGAAPPRWRLGGAGAAGRSPGRSPKPPRSRALGCGAHLCSPPRAPGVTGVPQHRWAPAVSLGARESHSTTASHHAHLAAPLGPHSLPWVLDHLSASCRPLSIPQHPANLSASPGPHSIPETPQHPQDPAVSHGGSYLHVSSVTTPGKHTTGSWGSVCTETPVERVVQEKNSISQLLFG